MNGAPTLAYVSSLHDAFYSDIGGCFHPSNKHLYATSSADLRQETASLQLEFWIQRSKNKTQENSINACFEAAVQNWVQEQMQQLHHNKEFCAKWMDLMSPESDFLSTTINLEIERFSQPPVFKDEDEFVLVDDANDKQLAILEEWKEQPTLVLEALPQVRDALDRLKNRQNES